MWKVSKIGGARGGAWRGALAAMALLLAGTPLVHAQVREESADEFRQRAQAQQDAYMRQWEAEQAALRAQSEQPAQTAAPPALGTGYAIAREMLQAQGYEPLVFPRGGEWDPCHPTDICKAYPEIIDCSGTGFNPCRFAFRDAQGGYLVGVTAGETPDAMSLDALARANAQDTRVIENLLAGRAMFAEDAIDEPMPAQNGQDAVTPAPTSPPDFENGATTTGSNQVLNTVVFLVLIVAALAIYLIPTFIAFSRGHRYKFPIMAFNIGAGWSGIGWIWTLVWSLWPQNTALVDPFIGDATGIDRRAPRSD